ncbi:hypothetical protein CIB48_g1847 [Xylaria polymorpha]|nr:hypothetical protein CIB48_g1847 [Xylaria polymorpha]
MPSYANNKKNGKKAKKSRQGSQHSYSSLPAGQSPLDRYISEAEAHERIAMGGSYQRATGQQTVQQTVQQWDSAWNQASGSG